MYKADIIHIQHIYDIKIHWRNSLTVQWLGLHAFTAEGSGSVPGWGTKIPQAVWHGQKKFIGALFKKKKFKRLWGWS